MIRIAGTACLLGLLYSSACRGEEPSKQRLGNYGMASRLAVRGSIAFDPDQITRTLAFDPDILCLSHPSTVLQTYLKWLEYKVRVGYAHCGFPYAKATAELERVTDRIVVTVEEGDRYLAGKIVVRGAKQLDTQALADRLTSPQRPNQAVGVAILGQNGITLPEWVDADGNAVEPVEPAWRPGHPLAADGASRDRLREQVRRACEDLGFCSCRFEFFLSWDKASHTASLVVDVQEEGPLATIEQLVVEGLQRDTREELLQFLELRPDDFWSFERQIDVHRRLWESGRYTSIDIRAKPPEKAGDRAAVQLKLIEYSKAPKLSEPLSREEQTMVRAAEHLTNLSARGEDLVFDYAGRSLYSQFIVSPDHGVLGVLRDSATASIASALVLSKQTTGFYVPERKRKAVGSSLPIQIKLTLGMELGENARRRRRFSFGIGAASQDEPPGAPCTFITKISPAAFLAFTHEHDATTEWQGNRLVVRTASETMEFEEATGRLISIRFLGDEGALTVVVARGAFEARLKEIEESASEIENGFDPARPLASIVEFSGLVELASKVFARGKIDPLQIEAARKILTPAILEPIDNWLVQQSFRSQSTGDKFTLPEKQHAGQWWQKCTRGLSHVALAHCDKVFPRRSWPWIVLRESAAVTLGRSEYLSHDAGELYTRPDAGPICQWVCACLMGTMSPASAARFARRGEERLTAEAFRRDCEVLFDPNFPLGGAIARGMEAVRGLNAEEAEVFRGSDWWPLVEAIRSDPSPNGGGISNHLAGQFEPRWRDLLRNALRQFAPPGQ